MGVIVHYLSVKNKKMFLGFTNDEARKEPNMATTIQKLVNLTPHAITMMDDNENIICIIEPSGTLARVSVRTERTETLDFDGVKLATSKSVYGEVEGLPEETDGVAYVVSSLVAQRVPERNDVFIPNESVRDEKGRIIGCKSLGRI